MSEQGAPGEVAGSVAVSSRFVRLIEVYQRAFAGRPSPCRFTPTCSAYAHEALQRHGTGKGMWLTLRRLTRCRPFGPSGFDPVPLTTRPPERLEAPVCRIGSLPQNDATLGLITRPPKRLEAFDA